MPLDARSDLHSGRRALTMKSRVFDHRPLLPLRFEVMRILYVDQYAGGPELGMEFRTHYMSREWISLGHDVLVVAGNRSHLRTRDLSVGRNDISGVTYWALRTSPYEGNGPARFLNIVSFRLRVGADEA